MDDDDDDNESEPTEDEYEEEPAKAEDIKNAADVADDDNRFPADDEEWE